MSKAMTIAGMVVAGFVGLIFALDWVLGIPFATANWKMNLGAILAASTLGYLSYSTFRELR